jgi:L-asparaginase/beta-aspartyl-peptidase (threonine type)
MDESPHVLLAGEGAAAFAAAHGLARVTPDWFTPVRGVATPPLLSTGTVGCAALDETGALAAATSTGGVPNKVLGRVGDSPIVGAGVWADERVAVSCTGAGEFFIRAAAAAQISFRMGFGGQSLADAAAASLADVVALGGGGGLIALSATGEIAMPYTAGMKRAALRPDGAITAEVL